MKIRVVTLNLLHGAPIPGARRARESLSARLDWTGQHLKELCPDIVLLQEASITPRIGNTAEILARRLDMEFVYARANPSPALRPIGVLRKLARALAFEEGPAVLSRFPIIRHRVHRLSPRARFFERRIALEAVLEGPVATFSAFSVHLTAGSAASRARQAAALVRAVEAAPHPHPHIVGGDFNAEEDTHEIRGLTEIAGWLDSFRHIHGTEVIGHTWGQRLAETAATAGRRIDFLFSAPSRDEHWDPHHSRLILDRAFPDSGDGVLWASDHYGVLTDFEAPTSSRNSEE